MSVPKIPNCPAAPSSAKTGWANRGRKSIIAPTPRNISSGKSSLLTPTRYKSVSSPFSPTSAESGRLASRQPTPMGKSNTGSYSLAIAR